METVIRRTAIALLALLGAAGASAQEFDVFDLNDFLDPRERGAVFSRNGRHVKDEGNPFTVIRAVAGHLKDYQWHNLPTDVDVHFLQISSSHYSGNKQFNVKFTSLEGDEAAHLPRYRATVQVAYYLGIEQPGAKSDKKPLIASRYLFTWSAEQNPLKGKRENETRSVNPEFGVEADVLLALPKTSVIGSFVFIRRSLPDGKTADRLTYIYRPAPIRIGHVRLSAEVGVGGERTEGWAWGAVRSTLICSIPVGFIGGNIDISYAPTYVPRTDYRTHHEIGIFLERTLFARVQPQAMRRR